MLSNFDLALSRVEREVKVARAFQVATSKKALRAISVLVTLSRGIDCLWVLGFILYRRPNPSFKSLVRRLTVGGSLRAQNEPALPNDVATEGYQKHRSFIFFGPFSAADFATVRLVRRRSRR